MNGEKIDNDKIFKNPQLKKTRSTVNELAATTEKNDQEFSSFTGGDKDSNTNSSIGRKQSLQKFKPLISTIVLALSVGLIMGFIMLRVFGSIDNGMATPGHNPIVNIGQATEDTNAQKDEAVNAELPKIEAYILQGGVFSNKANAEKLAKDYQANNVSAIVWEREAEFYLIVGLSVTQDGANKLASNMKEKRLEAFVKEWVTPAREVELTKNEEEWIHSFQQLLTESIKGGDDGIGNDLSKWEEQLENAPEESEKIMSFKKSIHSLLDGVKENGGSFAQQDLLQLWFHYENF